MLSRICSVYKQSVAQFYRTVPVDELWLLDKGGKMARLYPSFFSRPERICAQIRKVPRDKPIKVIIRTAGGGLRQCEKILKSLRAHPAGYNIYIRNEVFSAGALLALGADEIVMDEDSYLGKIDPQMSLPLTRYSIPCIIYKNCQPDIIKHNYMNWALSQQILQYMDNMINMLSLAPAVRRKVKAQMIYSNLPHFQTFDRYECLRMGLPVRMPTPEEKAAYW